MGCTIYLQESDTVTSEVLKRLLSCNRPIKLHSDVGSPAHFKTYYSSITKCVGICGALALIINAYGAYGLRQADSRTKQLFQMGAHYQLVHSIAMLGIPFVTYPRLTASLFVSGIALFSGSCYHMALTKRKETIRASTVGAVTLVLAWLSILL